VQLAAAMVTHHQAGISWSDRVDELPWIRAKGPASAETNLVSAMMKMLRHRQEKRSTVALSRTEDRTRPIKGRF